MRRTSFIVGFFLTMILTISTEAVIANASQPDQMGLVGYFAVLTFTWLNNAFFIHLFLFAIYFLLARFIVHSVKKGWQLWLSMGGLALVFLGTVVMDDWNLSRLYFKGFNDYLRGGGHYPLYAVIVIVVVTGLGISVFANRKKEADLMPSGEGGRDH